MRYLAPRCRVYGLIRRSEQAVQIRQCGGIPLLGDLDQPQSLNRLSGLAHWVIHTAPPPAQGEADPRTTALIQALAKGGSVPQRFIYISTSGVYGDCGGEWVSETRRVSPHSARALRRVAAERALRHWGRRSGVVVNVLRVPGIYAADRLPLARLQQGTAALLAEEDSYSNHIHAADLARAIVYACRRGRPQRVYHVSDDQPEKMGDYFDQVARWAGLPCPPRVSRAEAPARLGPGLWSFVAESRRLSNYRLRHELKLPLQYPGVADFLARTPRPVAAKQQLLAPG
jgi:nucleoside-diphosphate-sugar epimerase